MPINPFGWPVVDPAELAPFLEAYARVTGRRFAPRAGARPQPFEPVEPTAFIWADGEGRETDLDVRDAMPLCVLRPTPDARRLMLERGESAAQLIAESVAEAIAVAAVQRAYAGRSRGAAGDARRTVLALRVSWSPVTDVGHRVRLDSFDDVLGAGWVDGTGFAEIWVANYRGIAPYWAVDLFALAPQDIWGLHDAP